MFSRPLGVVLSLVLCVCCLFGNLYRLQAQPPTTARPPTPPTPPPTAVAAPQSNVRVASENATDIKSEFYQTILRNNLFAPLGTVLHAEPEPGRHLTLVGTFLSEDPSASSVLVKNTATGRHHLLSVGEGVGDFHVLAVEAKQVRFYHHGTEVSLHLPRNVLLNAKRR